MTPSDLSAIESRALAATPEPLENLYGGRIIAGCVLVADVLESANVPLFMHARQDILDLCTEVRRLQTERAGWEKLVDEWRTLALTREGAHTQGYREGRDTARAELTEAQLEELVRLRSQQEMWLADKTFFESQKAENRVLRDRVASMLRDLDRGADYWERIELGAREVDK